jgi:hypothetical protein
VLLEVVALVGDVGDHFVTIGQTNLRNLTDSGVRLLGSAGHDLHANAAAERVAGERGGLGLRTNLATSFAHELVDGWHIEVWL